MDKIKKYLSTTQYKNHAIEIASVDASFRQYFRLTLDDTTVLLMDSSLEKESLNPFIDVTNRLLAVGVKAPMILEKNLRDGFLIIEDFGNIHYLNLLNQQNYKTFLHFEMDLMQEWYLEKQLQLTLNDTQKEIIKIALDTISNIVLSQPQDIFVHRDFHSRNIMLSKDEEIGVIDYQDAMSGAITYDLVSLLKDCYIAYDRDEILKLILEFRDKKGLNTEDEEFIKWFDFTGMQRHIKVLGIFSRLSLRDSKDGYLKDIPLTLSYLLDTASRYKETKELAKLLQELQ